MKRSLGPNTLIVPTPVWVIGTYDEDGKPNLMTAAWAGVCCSEPASISVAVRKNRRTYENLLARKAFTVNVPSERHVKEADYVGMVSGKSHDKFKDTGLTPVRSDLVDAPYVREFPLVLECRLAHTLDVGIHTLFVGEIADVKAEEDVLDKSGYPDIEKVGPIVYTPGGRAYHSIGKPLGRGFSIGKR